MQDKLKQFVEDHRDELELYQPREHLWDAVEGNLQKGRSGMHWQRLAIAASVLLLLTCGTWIFIANKQHSARETAIVAQPPLMQAEAYFTMLLQMKDDELDQYCRPQPQLCHEFEQDMEALNYAYRQLKTEYATSADKKAILKAMATNLQMQVQLISQQLRIMESVQQKAEVFKTI